MFDTQENIAWLILLLPLLAAVVITFFTAKQAKLSALISIAAVAVSFLLSLYLAVLLQQNEVNVPSIKWLSVGKLQVDFGLLVDRLSFMMLLVVTGVGAVIHIFSYGYMKEDPSFSRFLELVRTAAVSRK